jgi:ribonuclease BN (tRNA processing enzyme)
VGYRIEDGGRSLAYLTDHEPALAVDLATVQPEWVSGFEVAAEADVLIHDCQYTEQEYPDRAGFGHSSTHHVADFARLAGARRLLLFHHDPNHSDDELEALCERVRELWSGGTVDLAREGGEIDFG